MEPAYSKNDVLLIEKQSLVNIEKIGIFMIHGDILKSHNAIYDAILVANQTVCLGKALGHPMKKRGKTDMEKLEFIINKFQTEVNQVIEKLLNQKDLENNHIFYNGRNEGEYSFSFIIKNENNTFKFKILILKIEENYTKIVYPVNNNETDISYIEIINSAISEKIESEINRYDIEAKKGIKSSYKDTMTNATPKEKSIPNNARKQRRSKLPIFLKAIAIITFILGIITAFILSYTKTITTDYSYFGGLTYDTSYKFDFSIFLSYIISYVVYSAIVYSIGEILEVVIENNQLLKQNKD